MDYDQLSSKPCPLIGKAIQWPFSRLCWLHTVTTLKYIVPAASLRDGLPLPFQTEESLLVSSSVQSWRVGNSSVVCSRIYLQAARGRGKGNEHNSIILNLTSWSWHILYPSPLAMSIITLLPFPGLGFLSMEARPSLKLWFQPSSPLYPLDMWRPLSHQPISAQNKDIRLTW